MVKFKIPPTKKAYDIIEMVLVFVIVLCLNFIVAQYFFRIDFTEDKRYSVSEQAKDMLSKVNDNLTIDIYLSGKLDPEYERLRIAIEDKIEQFKAYAPGRLEIRFIDPLSETDEAIRERQLSMLVQKGLQPMVYMKEEAGKKEQVRIFPGAIMSYKEREVPIQFIKGVRFTDEASYINQAVEGVEFELLQAIRKLNSTEFVDIAFVSGHGELEDQAISSFMRTIGNYYSIQRINLATDTSLSQFKTIVIAEPKTAFSEQEKFLLDQYLMQGGSLMYLVDPVEVRTDSLKNGQTFAVIKELNFDDQLFKYGIRLNKSIIQDLQCGIIPIQTGMNGETQLLNFPYFPLFYNFGKHAIVKNLDAVYSKFASSLDTVKATGITKTPLILSSTNARVMAAPFEIDLDALKKDATPEKFNQSNIMMACLLEGKFNSLYKNRPSPIASKAVVGEGVREGKVIVIADGDLMVNDWDPQSKQPLPLGYDKFTRTQFSNSEFLLNALDYLCGQNVIMAKNKDIVLRPLNKFKAQNERTYWQTINLLMPIVVLIALGFALFTLRKKRYSKF
jgi:ABC-2 type transport system permease protein